MKTLTRLVTLTLALGFLAGPVLADRAPTAQEWQRVVTQLSSLGFTSWKEIEWDDGYWEVDDAIGPDGRTLRCAKCRHNWFQDGPPLGTQAASPQQEPLPQAAPPPLEAPSPPPIARRTPRGTSAEHPSTAPRPGRGLQTGQAPVAVGHEARLRALPRRGCRGSESDRGQRGAHRPGHRAAGPTPRRRVAALRRARAAGLPLTVSARADRDPDAWR